VAIGLALAMTSTVSAYHGQTPKTVTVSPSQGTFTCGKWYTVTATVFDQNGNPIARVRVHWSFKTSPSSHDQIEPLSTRTGSAGRARTKVKLACVAGDRVIKAKIHKASGTALVHVRLRHHHRTTTATGAVLGATSGDPSSLPSTSTLPPSAAADSPSNPAIPIIPALFVVLAGGGIVFRRSALTRR
jgi:hypothetical protein